MEGTQHFCLHVAHFFGEALIEPRNRFQQVLLAIEIVLLLVFLDRARVNLALARREIRNFCVSFAA